MSKLQVESESPRECVFKNEIANQLFFSRKNLCSSILTTEFRVGSTRLDLVVANGTTTCYEIKTDRDNLRRLRSQLSGASSVFDRIYVVTTPRYMESVCVILKSYPHVGLYVLGENEKLNEEMPSTSNAKSIKATDVFNCFRQDEYIALLNKMFGFVPNIPNTRMYKTCKKMFCTIEISEIHKAFESALRSRVSRKLGSDDSKYVPYKAHSAYKESL
jgi:hypothetical protein